MKTDDIRKCLHDLTHALSAAKINAYLLQSTHGEALDKESSEGLNSALYDAERLVSEFYRRIDAEIIATQKVVITPDGSPSPQVTSAPIPAIHVGF